MGKLDSVTKPSDPAPPRLVRFKVEHNAIMGIGPQFHRNGVVQVDNPPNDLVGWTVQFRGGAVFFASPPGWEPAGAPRKDGEVHVVGPIPLKDVTCVWRGADGNVADRISRLDVGPLKRTPQPVDVAVGIDPKEMGDA